MHLRRFYMVILMLLVCLQSFTVVADIHQFHQSGSEHKSFEHNHFESDDIKSADHHFVARLGQGEQGEQGDSRFDCHHCCHCHGHGFAAINDVLVAKAKKEGADYAPYRYLVPATPLPSLFRPPIAS